MLTEKFEIFLALLAGLILLVVGILMNFSLPAILLRLLIVLAAFYIIGLVVKTYLRKRIFFEIEDEEGLEASDFAENGEEALTEADETESDAKNQPVL